jgi:NAD(P)-dependent dehydrogenase (short-subunit alcohol dehydrogenase family)
MAFRKMFDLTGKRAVVTGGCGILGTRFCAALAELGAAVAVVDLVEADPAGAAARLRDDHGATGIGVVCDVGDAAAVAAMVAQVTRELGGIDILLNNAATKTDDLRAFFAAPEDYDLDTWRQVMAVNLDGMFLVAQAAGRQMIAQGAGGSIVQTASIYGVMAPDQRIYEGSDYLGGAISTPASYSASKAGVVGLTRHLASLWAAHGIRVNALCPGGVRSGQNDTFVARYADRVPMGRMAEADEIAGVAMFLAGAASSYITGQCLMVDGGLSAW